MSKATAKALWAVFAVLTALASRYHATDSRVTNLLQDLSDAITEGEGS